MSGTYLFTVNNPIKLELQSVNHDKHEITLRVENNLPENEIVFKVRQRANRVELNLPEQTYSKNIKGTSTITIPYSIEQEGINEIEIISLYPVKDTVLQGDTLLYGIEIQKESDSVMVIDESSNVEEYGERIESKNFIQRIFDWIKNLFT